MGSYHNIAKKQNFWERWAARRKKAQRLRELAFFKYDCCDMMMQLRKRGYHMEADALERILLQE